MGWGILAVAVIGLILIIRGVGFSEIQARWLEEDGKRELARALRFWIGCLWTGVLLGMLGAFWNVAWLQWTGFALLLGGFGILTVASQRTRRGTRSS